MSSQKIIWDKHWEKMVSKKEDIREELKSRFVTREYPHIKSFIDSENDKLILEVGSGTGRFCCLLAQDFPHCRVMGIDVSQHALSIANYLKESLRLSNCFFEKGDMFSLPYPDEHFDVVFSDGVIEHFPLESKLNYKVALKEMIRVTKRGGKVIVAVPNWFCLPHTIYKWLLKRLGKSYPCGYEKSFKHKELINLFKEFKLTDLRLVGFYPAHGLFRLAGYSKIFTLCGQLVDKLDTSQTSKIFGFEIIVKGNKTLVRRTSQE